MAYITLPDSHWYRTNPVPVNSDKTFNKEIFKEGLRLETNQVENVLSMLVTEAVQSGFLPSQNLMQQVKKKNISDAIRRVYERERDFYGWGAINEELVKDYLLHGIVHKWIQKSAIGAPSPLSKAGLNNSGAGPANTSPPCRASHSKLTGRSISHDEHLGNVSEKSSGSSHVESASPIAPRKRSRKSSDGDDLNNAEAKTPRVKKTRTQVTKIDLSKNEPTMRQKLEMLRDDLRKDEADKRKELNDKVKELGHVEGMLRDLVQEEDELAEVEDKVNKTREKAAAMYAASVAGRAESKK